MTKDYNLDPVVAAYALFRTDFQGIDVAIEHIFEKDEQEEDEFGSSYMRHSCVPYVPAPTQDQEEEKKQEPIAYLDKNK